MQESIDLFPSLRGRFVWHNDADEAFFLDQLESAAELTDSQFLAGTFLLWVWDTKYLFLEPSDGAGWDAGDYHAYLSIRLSYQSWLVQPLPDLALVQ
jgi:hypothetical protein